MPLSCIISRPSSMLRRSTRPSVKATAPTLIEPSTHRWMQNQAIAVIMTPESVVNAMRTPVNWRVKGRSAAR